MSELFDLSKKYKETANIILTESGLIDDLKKYGKVHFTGAYSANLMMHGDVDITVVRDNPYTPGEVFEILRELYFKGAFRSCFIGGDWDDPRKGKEFPNGYYIGLKHKLNGERWKFDIWFVGQKDFDERANLFQIDKIAPTNEQKEKILYFKKYRNDNKLNITGQKIYEAVINKGCQTTEQLMDFINTKN